MHTIAVVLEYGTLWFFVAFGVLLGGVLAIEALVMLWRLCGWIHRVLEPWMGRLGLDDRAHWRWVNRRPPN